MSFAYTLSDTELHSKSLAQVLQATNTQKFVFKFYFHSKKLIPEHSTSYLGLRHRNILNGVRDYKES